MDFEFAANRLKKDQDELRTRARRRPQTLASTKATLEAKKRQEYRQKQLEKKRQNERIVKLKFDHVRRGFDKVEQRLGVLRTIDSESANGDGGRVLKLEATSVHGQGDKITLPPSLLSTLANRDLLRTSQERGQPLFFRLGIRRPDYVFPASDSMKLRMENCTIKSEPGTTESSHGVSAGMEEHIDDEMDAEDEEEMQHEWEKAYLDELSHEYVSYVYATVIEFTQDEGYIGLPKCMATALLQRKLMQPSQSEKDSKLLESKLTVDPANTSSVPMDVDDNDDDVNNNSIDQITTKSRDNNDEDEDEALESKTPGHPAYGLFPIPKHDQIEVTLVTHLPLGKKCTLQPTQNAIQNGFYNLKDVKLALEQSLIRTRGCLNVNDTVHCWNRGKKFDLKVQDVTPSYVGAVSCVNTDVEVDIAAVEEGNEISEGSETKITTMPSNLLQPQSQTSSSTGYRLSDERPNNPNDNVKRITRNTLTTTNPPCNQFYQTLKTKNISKKEPPMNQEENIITIQIRGDRGKQCRRRFDTTSSKVEDLFILAVHEDVIDGASSGMSTGKFRLVTRYPRRVFTLESDGHKILADISLSKQELFMIEKIK